MLNDVPEGWQVKLLGEVCNPKQHPTIQKAKFTSEGYPVYGANGQIGCYSDYTHSDRTIAITCRGATCGTINIVPPKSYITGNAMALDLLNESVVTFDFLSQYLRRSGVEECITGSAQPQITRSSLLPVELILPPLNEQKRIAEILSSVDESIQATQAVIEQAERVKRGLMEELLTGGLGSEAIERGEVPEGWQKKRFGDIASVKNGFAFKSKDFVDSQSSIAAVVRMSDLKNGTVEAGSTKKIPLECVEGLEKFKLKIGDFIFGMSGSLSNYAVVPVSSFPMYLNQRVGKLEPKNSDAVFLKFLYTSEAFMQRVEKSAYGNAQLNISGKQIESFEVLVPPLNEQKRIAQILSSVDATIASHKANIEQQSHVKKGLMDDLLTGKVRTV